MLCDCNVIHTVNYFSVGQLISRLVYRMLGWFSYFLPAILLTITAFSFSIRRQIETVLLLDLCMYFNNVYLFCTVCIFCIERCLDSLNGNIGLLFLLWRGTREEASAAVNSVAIQWWEIGVQERTKASIYTALWTIILNVKSALNFQILLSYLLPSKTSCHQLNDFFWGKIPPISFAHYVLLKELTIYLYRAYPWNYVI